MSARKTLSKSSLIRMDKEMHDEIEKVARANKISVSAIIRMAVANQLPLLKSGSTVLRSR